MTDDPPLLARWLVTRSLRGDERDAVLGDLHEEYLEVLNRHGRIAARRWYWRQTATSVLPNLRRRGQRPATANVCANSGGAMDSLLCDTRYAARMLRRRPLVAGVALASLIVGISLSTVVFSLLNAVLLRPLPVADPDRLAVLLEVRPDGINHNFSYPDFTDYRAAQRTLHDLAAYSRSDVTIRTAEGSEVVAAELVSGAYFQVLGAPVRFGRPLVDADDRIEAPPAVVVSESLWRKVIGDDAGFSPRTVMVNARPFSIVGVVAAPFRGMEVGRDVSIWAPLQQQPALAPSDGPSYLTRRTMSWLTVIGRLRPSVAMERAAADLSAVERDVARSAGRRQPLALTFTSGRQGDSMLPQTMASPLMLLLAAAMLVLLVACANIANLMLSRSTERTREMAVRAAIGAGTARLVRLVLVETLLLGLLGGGAALLAARWLAALAVPFMTSYGEPVTLDVGLDWRILLFVTALALGATLAASLAPALAVRRTSPSAALGDGGRAASAGPRTVRSRRALVVVQFALSLALVVVAVLLARTVYNLRTMSTGLDLDHVALIAVDPEAVQYDAPRIRRYFADAIDRLSRLPGVRAVGFGRVPPLGFGGSRTTVIVPGYASGPNEDMEINFNRVSPGYFEAMGISLVNGRVFDTHDVEGRPLVLVVNQTMASRYWPNAPAVGQRVRFGRTAPDIEVVGVVHDVKYRMLREESGPSFYLPQAQEPASAGVIHVRTHGDPRGTLDTMRRSLTDVDPGVPIVTVRTLRDQANLNLNDERLAMLIGVTLGTAALLLAAIGLYGSMAYAVAQRQREIGVRIALGATPANIRRLVVGQGLALSLAGTLLGLGVAIAFARALKNRLFGVSAVDVPTLIAAASLLSGVAVLATLLPAWRASRIDPVRTLRTE